jgi:hypothetical protein
MKNILVHFSLIVAVMFLTLALAPGLKAQQADQDPAPATPRRADPSATKATQPNEAQMPASGDITTHGTTTFSGNIVRENGELVLKDPVTKVSYKLSDPAKAKPYLGKPVKVSGKLDTNSNTIQMDGIQPQS